MMDQRRMLRTEGIVLQTLKIGHGDNAGVDQEEEALQADDGWMQNVDDWGHSPRECEDWTVYVRPVKCNNGKANAMANDVSEGKTAL